MYTKKPYGKQKPYLYSRHRIENAQLFTDSAHRRGMHVMSTLTYVYNVQHCIFTADPG